MFLFPEIMDSLLQPGDSSLTFWASSMEWKIILPQRADDTAVTDMG